MLNRRIVKTSAKMVFEVADDVLRGDSIEDLHRAISDINERYKHLFKEAGGLEVEHEFE